ncbi:UbiE/COQ5 methyltransferase, partial [Zopfochytrium polystomum]
YDVMIDVMSGGVHRLWKDFFVRALVPGPGMQPLDVAGGTGTARLLSFLFIPIPAYGANHAANFTVVDINPNMLKVGMQRAEKLGHMLTGRITFQECNAEHLSSIPDASVDAFTIAFGIRNCTHVDAVVREAYRVLKPGGRFMCLEFGSVENPIIRSIYDTYSFEVIPTLGGLIANDRDSYQYLVESIRRFPPQPAFARMIRDAGFRLRGKGWEDLTFG